MPRKTLALITILVLVTIILFIIALRTTKQSPQIQPQPSGVQQTTPTSPAHSVLMLAPDPVAVGFGQQGSVAVNIATADNAVTAVQLEIAYDPTVITNVQVNPGALFPKPVILINKNTVQTGRYTYAFGITPGEATVNGTGTVATITFTAKGRVGQQSQLALLPTTLVTARGVAQSVLKSQSGTIISIVAPGVANTTITHPTAIMQQHPISATAAGK